MGMDSSVDGVCEISIQVGDSNNNHDISQLPLKKLIKYHEKINF